MTACNDKNRYIYTHISLAYRKYQIYMNQELEKLNLNSAEIPYLILLLFQEDGLLQDTLCEKTQITKAAASRSLRSLEEKGFIIRKESKHSKRHKQVFLTDKTKNIANEIRTITNNWIDILYSPLEEEEKIVVTAAFKKISKFLSQKKN